MTVRAGQVGADVEAHDIAGRIDVGKGGGGVARKLCRNDLLERWARIR